MWSFCFMSFCFNNNPVMFRNPNQVQQPSDVQQNLSYTMKTGTVRFIFDIEVRLWSFTISTIVSTTALGWRDFKSGSMHQSGGGMYICLRTNSRTRQLPTKRQKGQERNNLDFLESVCEGQLMKASSDSELMRKQGVQADSHNYARLLKGCIIMKALEGCKRVHANIVKSGMEIDTFMGNYLVNTYSKCESLTDARQVFDRMPNRNVVSFNIMIGAYTQNGYFDKAFQLLNQMQKERIKPNKISFVSILNACPSPAALAEAKLIHAHIIDSAVESDVIVGSALVNMYSKCASIKDACKVFHRMTNRDVISWNVMMAGYVLCGHSMEAVKLFWQMQREGANPNEVTLINILKACDNPTHLSIGKLVHAHIIYRRIESRAIVATAVVNMYSKCGSMEDAWRVFNNIPERDVVSWNAMIVGCQYHGQLEVALKLFWEMEKEDTNPNDVTFNNILSVCASLVALPEGKLIHAKIVGSRMQWNVDVDNALVNMYSKCGSIDDARRVFEKMHEQTVVSWSMMIAGYVQHGLANEALEFFHRMQCKGVEPDQFTFSSVVTACANLAALTQGKEIYAQIIKSGFKLDVIMENALIDMFAKCRSIEDARQVFDKMPYGDVVSWTAVIAGYAQHGRFEEASNLFQEMLREGVKPNDVTFITWLKTCASLGALEEGKLVHAHIVNRGMDSLTVENALIDMYAKCGCIEDARSVFDKMSMRDVVSWTVMITGCAHRGRVTEALELFLQMQHEGIKPDKFIFSSILSACSHAGLIDEGCQYFDSMIQEHGISPTMQHYAGMVDLFSRAGYFDEAESFISQMPCQPDVVVWLSLLASCRNYGTVELAECIVNCVSEEADENAAAFTLLANIYATSGKWDDEAKIRNMMEEKGMNKVKDLAGLRLKLSV